MLDLTLVLQLAASCASSVAPATIAAIARTESRFDPLAIGDNTTGRSYSPSSVAAATALASNLRLQGHSIDLGLMQINSANLYSVGMSIADAFDPCRSITAGGRLLREAYTGGNTLSESQAALRVALSRYNTGTAERGFTNGYVHRVEVSALQLVPALRVAEPMPQSSGKPPSNKIGGADAAAASSPSHVARDPAEPPEWDVWAHAEYQEQLGARGATQAPPIASVTPSDAAAPATFPDATGSHEARPAALPSLEINQENNK